MVDSLLLILKHTLGIYETKQARKYLDRVIELELKRNEELNSSRIDMGVIDTIDAELRVITEAASRFGKPNAAVL